MYNILEPCPKFIGAQAIDDRMGGQGEILASAVNAFYAAVTERLYRQAEEAAKILGDFGRRLNKALKRQDTLLRPVAEFFRQQVSNSLQENYGKLTHVAQSLSTESGQDPTFEAPGAADFTAHSPAAMPAEVMNPPGVAAPKFEAPESFQSDLKPTQPPAAGVIDAAALCGCLERLIAATRAGQSAPEEKQIITSSGDFNWRGLADALESAGLGAEAAYRGLLEVLGNRMPGQPTVPIVRIPLITPADAPGPLGPVTPTLAAYPAACDAPSQGLIALGSY